MYTYSILYYDSKGRTYTLWIKADSENEAESKAYEEYWNIDTILDIHKED